MSDTIRKNPYIDRDISWMYFNHRILQQARRDDLPLLERLNFLGIYSNNLDEFFRVRMATVSRIAMLSGRNMAEQRAKANELFHRLTTIDARYSTQYADCIRNVLDELSKNKIHVLSEDQLDEEQEHFVRCIFRKKISGFVSPLWISKLHGFSRESDSHIYLAVRLSGQERKTDYAVIEIPTSTCGRFLVLPERDGENFVMYLDDIIRFCLPMIFPGMGFTEFQAYSFKFTKDAEMEIDNDLHVGQMEKVAKAVKSRKKGATLRLLYDEKMPPELLEMLKSKLNLDKLDTIQPSGRYQNHKDFMQFPYSCRKDLKYPAWPAAVPPELKGTDSLIQLVYEKDRFIQVPYQTFDYVIRLLQEAAVSKNVKSVKISLYRLAKNSKIVEALKCAAKNGKKVTAVVELQARFDESSNIHYAKEMQDAGINVVFGVEGLKIHSKIAHISLKNGRNIAVVGTGNFHEGNASSYTDYFLMTANPKITREVGHVFDVIKQPYKMQQFVNLMVSPFNMREKFMSLIEDEIANAKKGKEAWIKVKINHVTDEEIVEKLYKASREGVKIDMLVRGNCSIVTGVQGVSENIHIAGIIDRYLEHSRIFIFHAGGENKTYMGSADWMPRNLDRRIEVITRVFDPGLQKDLLRTLDYGLRDNVSARVVDGSDDNNIRVIPGESEPFRSQEKLYEYYSSEK
ncbi:MAG: RNA degradosome polyphosphate kinase [Candidatus Amulumruptor caecigallinarius]|nr:RNA degradosome polyphosphate kinase [Candidatus Amulumruptor caecigallinarius]